MSKVIFLGLPFYGHTNLTLPLVKELVARGEQVLYYSTQTFKEDITRTGAQYRDYSSRSQGPLTERVDDEARITYLLMQAAERVLEVELDGIRQESPDYIVH